MVEMYISVAFCPDGLKVRKQKIMGLGVSNQANYKLLM